MAGVGYASADLDTPIVGVVNNAPVHIDDDAGFTLNAGAGVKYYATDPSSCVSRPAMAISTASSTRSTTLNTVETTLGVGWKF